MIQSRRLRERFPALNMVLALKCGMILAKMLKNAEKYGK